MMLSGLQEREDFMRLNKRLVAERAGLVRTLHDYAVGRMADHDAALAASRELRTNVMVEVGVQRACFEVAFCTTHVSSCRQTEILSRMGA